MVETVSNISDSEFLRCFEERSLDPVYFDHIGHLRLSWLILRTNGLETSVSKVLSGIDGYASSLGDIEKFHKTITDSFVRIIAQRMAIKKHSSWEVFLQDNTDLVDDALSLLFVHFNESTLMSDEARIKLIEPDLRPIM